MDSLPPAAVMRAHTLSDGLVPARPRVEAAWPPIRPSLPAEYQNLPNIRFGTKRIASGTKIRNRVISATAMKSGVDSRV